MIKKNNNGFTLIEMLISTAILSIIVIAFSTISISSIKGNSKNNIDIGAMNIAQGEIENIRSQLKKYSGEDPLVLTSVEGEEIRESIEGEEIPQNASEGFSRTNDSGAYNVKIELKKAKSNDSIYLGLYDIKVSVVPDENKEYFSKKTTELVTQIGINKILTP